MHIKHIPVAKSESFQTKGKEKLIIKQENMNNMATVEVSNKVIEKDNTVLCMLSTAIIQSLMNRIDSLEHAMEDFRSKVNVNDFVSQVIDNVQNTITEKEMLNVTEAAEYLGISKSTIYKLTCSHTIPFYKPLGKTIYIDRKDLIDWMKTNHDKILRCICFWPVTKYNRIHTISTEIRMKRMLTHARRMEIQREKHWDSM